MADSEQTPADTEAVKEQAEETPQEEQPQDQPENTEQATDKEQEETDSAPQTEAAPEEEQTVKEEVESGDKATQQPTPVPEKTGEDAAAEGEQEAETQAAPEPAAVTEDAQADAAPEETAAAAEDAAETAPQEAAAEDVAAAGTDSGDVSKDEETAPQQEQDTAQQEPPSQPSPEPTRDDAATGTEAPKDGTTEPEVDPHAPSPEPKADLEANATVRFVLMPSGQVATLRCNLSQTLGELKEHFASELKMPATLILLMFDGKNMENTLTLADLGVRPNGTVQLEMQSADPVNTPIKAIRPRQEYHMPDVITVRVQTSEGEEADIVVEIERATRKKPFLGGYRHKKTGVEFHHASAQTMQKRPPPPNVERFCRDTQTVQQRHQVQQTKNDMATQMTKIGVYVSNMEDKLVVPGKYTTAEEYQGNMLNKVVILQKYYRRWLAKRYVEKVRQDKEARMEWEREEDIRKRKEKEDRIRREFERRMNPKTKEDFDLLYHALEKWRNEELEKINSTLTGAERKAALCQLLDQETQLIASIGRHKIEADEENRQKRVQGFLDKAAAPKKWKGRDGKTTEMDTPYTIRAQELKDIYNSLNMKYLTQDERLDVLLTTKHTVKEHDCKLTQEMIELIDREADLLMRGVKESNLDGLRKRISTLFLQYIKTPTFNPEAARLLKVPQDPSQLRKDIYFCPSCNQYLPSVEFQLSSNSRVVGKCRKCRKIDNDARTRQDYSHYRFMLKTLQRSEQDYGDKSTIAFLLQENDLRHLVENVWNSQSALSAWEDVYDLVLVRWNKLEEWSPWNCILLTKDEASAHEKLDNMEEGYGKSFIHKVKHRHTLARNYFSRLPGMAEHMRTREETSASLQGPTVTGRAVPVQPSKA